MLAWLFDRFILSTAYVRFSSEQIQLLDMNSGFTVSAEPLVAIRKDAATKKSHIVAAGNDARAAARDHQVELVNVFEHPRIIFNDFLLAEKLVRQLFKKAYRRSLLATAPRILFHPLQIPDDGLTEIEIRMLVEVALSAGASRVYLWSGPELSLEALKQIDFNKPGGYLHDPNGKKSELIDTTA